jgi:hypothetical protein
LTNPGEFICRRHRHHERPSLYLRKDHGQLIAAHWPGSGLESAHEIVHGVSDEHRRQVDYLQRAGEVEGFEVRTEVHLPTRVVPDAVVYGSQVTMGVEVQRSAATAALVKARTTKARRAGVLSVWFSDAHARPRWMFQVPGVSLNPGTSWATVPPPRTVTVVAGVRQLLRRRCRDWPNGPCPQHSRGCAQWHPDHAALPVWADELPAYVPAGKLVPMVFHTFSGREQVLIVTPDDKRRYEVMVGHAADLPLTPGTPRRAGQGERIECAADAGRVRTADHLPLTPAQQETAWELPWYRAWLLGEPTPERNGPA